jgi:Phage integrase family
VAVPVEDVSLARTGSRPTAQRQTGLADCGSASARPQAGLELEEKTGPNDKGSTRLSPESEAAYRAIHLHVHDLRHEGGSRLLEAGWPVHYVQHMLGHASLQQTSTYLNATLRGLHESMRNLDQSRPACKPLANTSVRRFRPVRKQAPARNGKSLLH